MNLLAPFDESLSATHAMREANVLSTRKSVACLRVASGPLPVTGARDVR